MVVALVRPTVARAARQRAARAAQAESSRSILFEKILIHRQNVALHPAVNATFG
jgi:hypothetical protein